MVKPMSPCKECEKSGCGAYHSKCPGYLAFREAIEEYREERRKLWDTKKEPVKRVFFKKEY